MSHLMIRVKDISKKYVLAKSGNVGETYITLRESLTRFIQDIPKNLSFIFNGKSGEFSKKVNFWALKDVSFEVMKGDRLAILGRNGAGKSTLLKIMSRITEPTSGRIEIYGSVANLLEVGTGFHPELTGRENIYLNGAILGMSRKEVSQRFDEIVSFAEVRNFLDVPIKRYSSGMYMRLAFSVAAHLDTQILIVDEVLAVGDAQFQKKCIGKMSDISNSGKTIIFVSHNMPAVRSLCNKAICLNDGGVIAAGDVDDVIKVYLDEGEGGFSMPLGDRLDRQGNGEAKFISIEISALRDEGPIFVDSELLIKLMCKTVIPTSVTKIMIGISDEAGIAVCGLDTSVAGFEWPKQSSGEFAITCATAPLNLNAGRYTLNLAMYSLSGMVDYVGNAAEIFIVEHDFFGTGKLPPKNWSLLLLKQDWRVV
jgi:lipopolysaccharide transport system ATP-binding protein